MCIDESTPPLISVQTKLLLFSLFFEGTLADDRGHAEQFLPTTQVTNPNATERGTYTHTSSPALLSFCHSSPMVQRAIPPRSTRAAMFHSCRRFFEVSCSQYIDNDAYQGSIPSYDVFKYDCISHDGNVKSRVVHIINTTIQNANKSTRDMSCVTPFILYRVVRHHMIQTSLYLWYPTSDPNKGSTYICCRVLTRVNDLPICDNDRDHMFIAVASEIWMLRTTNPEQNESYNLYMYMCYPYKISDSRF